MVPIDKDLIIEEMLNKFEEKWLNEYHNKVYNNLKTFMRKDEIMDLKKLVQLFKILFHSFSKIIFIFS